MKKFFLVVLFCFFLPLTARAEPNQACLVKHSVLFQYMAYQVMYEKKSGAAVSYAFSWMPFYLSQYKSHHGAMYWTLKGMSKMVGVKKVNEDLKRKVHLHLVQAIYYFMPLCDYLEV